MPPLSLTEDRTLVRREGEDGLLVQMPQKQREDAMVLSPARKERVLLNKVDDVVVVGEVTLTAAAVHLLLDPNIDVALP